MHPTRSATILTCSLAFACTTADAPRRSADAQPASAVAPSPDRLAGTPEGGLKDWVADIQAGLEGLSDKARADGKSAQKFAVDLYVGRQEWLERYWGTYGLLTQGVAPELGQAVMGAEARFHELLTVLTAETRQSEKVDAAIAALRAQLGIVLTQAESANVALEPPAETAGDSPESGGL